MPLWRTLVGAYQRAWERTALLFARPPGSVPREWLAEQCRLALSPGYLEAHLTVLRALVSPLGQRQVLVEPNRLSRRGRTLGAEDDPRNLVGGALRVGTTGGARGGLALLAGRLRSPALLQYLLIRPAARSGIPQV